MPGFTNRGMSMLFDYFFRGATGPTNFYVALVTSAQAPNADTNVLSDLTQIATGNNYASGGFQLTPNTTDFDFINENVVSDRIELQIKDVTWTAGVSGPIPSSGNGARYAVLTDDNVTPTSRQIIFWWDLAADRTVSTGQVLSLQNLELRGTTPVGVTNRGMKRMFNAYFRRQSIPANFNTALITSALAPTVDTDIFSTGNVTEIAIGNGYTPAGGIPLSRNSTDFDNVADNDINDRGEVRLKNIVFTASGGSLPASGNGARYMLLLDDNATAALRDVLIFWDLVADRTVTTGNTLTVQTAQLYGTN